MFTLDDLVRLLSATPFTPFRLHLSDGGYVDVRHREWSVTLTRRYAVIGISEPNTPEEIPDRVVFLHYLHVTRCEMLLPGQPPPGGTAPQAPVGTPA